MHGDRRGPRSRFDDRPRADITVRAAAHARRGCRRGSCSATAAPRCCAPSPRSRSSRRQGRWRATAISASSCSAPPSRTRSVERLDGAFAAPHRRAARHRHRHRLRPARPERTRAPTEGELRGVVHDDNARAMGGVAGPRRRALLRRRATSRGIVHALESPRGTAYARRRRRACSPPARLCQRMWTPSSLPGSTWCCTSVGIARHRWARGRARRPLALAPRRRRSPRLHRLLDLDRSAEGALGRAACRTACIRLPPPITSAIKRAAPKLHDAIVAALDDPAA